jgi:hypothetical protein
MKKHIISGVICFFVLSNAVQASDLPMLPIKTQQKNSPLPPQSYQQNNYNYNNLNFNGYDSIYYNTPIHCMSNCLYSTTLTTKELRALRKARKRAKLEAKCKNNKTKSSKCESLLED